MVPPNLGQGVGLLPLSIYEGEAAEPRLLAAARREGGLGVTEPSWCRQSGQLAAPVTGEPHLRCVVPITISTAASRNQESWEEAD